MSENNVVLEVDRSDRTKTRIVEQATGERAVNLIGYCLGGTLTAATLAWIAGQRSKRWKNRVKTQTFFTTMVDFAEAGDLTQPMEAGLLTLDGIAGDLAQLCAGSIAGRRSDTERTLFKSVGTAIEDLAAAELVWDRMAK